MHLEEEKKCKKIHKKILRINTKASQKGENKVSTLIKSHWYLVRYMAEYILMVISMHTLHQESAVTAV